MPKQMSRRAFLKVGATSAATAAVLSGCEFPRRWVTLEPYVRPPEEQLAGEATWYASACRQCPAGCGIIVRIMNGRALKIEGNPEHPLNRGKLCARGQAGLQLLYNPDRLPGPLQQAQRGSRDFRPLSWNEGLNALYEQVQSAGNSLAIWGGLSMPGHLVDAFKRLAAALNAPAPVLWDVYAGMSGYDALSRAGRDLFGNDGLPAYDLSGADIVISFGANFLGTGLSAVRYGVAFGGFRGQALGKRGYLVQLEPRQSITAAKADRWWPIKPGTQGLVAQALARIIADQAFGPADRVARAKTLAGSVDLNAVAAASDIPADELVRLARIFANAERPLAIPPATSLAEPDAVAAVQVLNVIGGADGLTLSTSPSAGLVRPLASSFADVKALIERMRGGQVKLLLVHGVNPLYEMPDKVGLADALSKVPFIVSFAPIVDETAVEADLILPDRTYLESWGYQVVAPDFGTPAVSSQQPVVTPVVDARSTADVILTVARGIPDAAKALPWPDEVTMIKEAIGQLPPGAAGGSGAEVLWARFLQHGGWWPATAPVVAPPAATANAAVQVASPQFQGDASTYPYFLHLYVSDLLSDGRGASQPWLQGSPDPMTTIAWQTWVELHPDTAAKLGVKEADIVTVTSPYGEMEGPVYILPVIRPDTVAIPLGQGHTDWGRFARNRGANPLVLVGAQADAAGSAPAWATIRVSVTRTGKRLPTPLGRLAKFESQVGGVTAGFINEAFPGQ